MKQGEKTKRAILDVALDMASRLGLECVTIGALADAVNMSKSGLFAHFQSKENLQIAVLGHAGDLFRDQVILPALQTKAGIPRIRALVDLWIEWTRRLKSGCIFVSASSEYADRPGKVRDEIFGQQTAWFDCLKRIAESAIKSGEFRRSADCEQFAYELHSLMLGFHLHEKLLTDPDNRKWQAKAFSRLLANYKRQRR